MVPRLFLIQPSGLRRTFVQTAEGWHASEGSETIRATAVGYEVTLANGKRLDFGNKTADVDGGVSYQLQTLTTLSGDVTRLEYDSKGLLTKVADGFGHSLQLRYRESSYRKLVRVNLGVLKGTGSVFEFNVSLANQKNVFRQVRLREADGAVAAVSGLAFFAPGSSQTLVGKPIGSGPSASMAFDQDDSTAFAAVKGEVNWCGLNLNKPSSVGHVIVVTTPEQAAALQGAVVEGYSYKTMVVNFIAEVEGSDGQIVSYDYDLLTEPVFGFQNMALVKADYHDGTSARYKYEHLLAGAQPKLVEADAPRNPAKAKRIRYDFYRDRFEGLGTIRSEINPDTGTTVVSLLFDENDPTRRTVRYSDSRDIHYKLLGKEDPLVVERTDSLGRTVRHEYDAKRRVKATIDHRGRRSEFVRDDKGALLERKRDGKTELRIARDAKGRVKSKKDKHGRETIYTRDEKGRVTQAAFADGTRREFSYDEKGNLTKRRTRKGEVQTFSHNERGLITAAQDQRGRTAAIRYDAQDRVSAVVDPLGRSYKVERNARGKLTKLTYPDGRTRSREYDQYGRISAKTDVKGQTTRYTRDYLGRVTREEDTYGRVTTTDYAELPGSCGCATLSGHPTTIHHHDGRVTKLLYDTEGNLLSRSEDVGTEEQATSVLTYDDNNRVSESSDPLGNTSRFTYDEQGKPLTQSDPLGRLRTLAYDENDQLTRITGPRGDSIAIVYDNKGRIAEKTDAAGGVTQYRYDEAGHLIMMKDAAGQKYNYEYDGDHRTAMIYPDHSRQTWAYDAVGRVIKTVSPDGAITTKSYDSGNRVMTETVYDSRSKLLASTTHTYDALGHRLSTTDALGRSTRWTNDVRGNVLTTTVPDGSVTSNTYDTKDRLLSTTDALGQTTRYAYDAVGNLVSLMDAKGQCLPVYL